MNYFLFKGIDAIYPIYMANLKKPRSDRYASAFRELRQHNRPDEHQPVRLSDLEILCHVARIAQADEARALVYVKGVVKGLPKQIDGRDVMGYIAANFEQHSERSQCKYVGG